MSQSGTDTQAIKTSLERTRAKRKLLKQRHAFYFQQGFSVEVLNRAYEELLKEELLILLELEIS